MGEEVDAPLHGLAGQADRKAGVAAAEREELDVDVGGEITQPAAHAHQRRDAAARGQEQQLLRDLAGHEAEPALGTVELQAIAHLDVIRQPVGDEAAGHALDGDLEHERARGRGGDGVGADDLLAVDAGDQRAELPGPVHEAAQRIALQAEGVDVVRVLDDLGDVERCVTARPDRQVHPGIDSRGVDAHAQAARGALAHPGAESAARGPEAWWSTRRH